MAFPRLTLRVGMPFVMLVLAGTLFLAWFIRTQLARQETERFARVATTIGVFIEQSSLPTSVGLARDLKRVTGNEVFLRNRNRLEPSPPTHLAHLPLTTVATDREPIEFGEHQCIAVPIPEKADLVMVRTIDDATFHPLVMQVLAAFVMLLLLTAWLVVRGLVRPLQNLMHQLPRIETDGLLDVPEARRQDEIGDVARAFLRTRQALLDERLARERVEKLAVLGRMTAALAHEVQNPVAAIRMHAQLLQAQGTDAASIIEHEAGRIENLLNQWMFLTRPEPPAMAQLDLGALLARVVTMHEAQAAHAAVEVQLDAAPGLHATADGRRLDQVFRNLLTNALQAMPGGGTLHLHARAHGDDLTIDFIDTGKGFSPTALQRFAEYFFSEKEGGMGIGLSVAQEIVRAHGGRLAVANREAGGARVTVTLPVTPHPPQPTSP